MIGIALALALQPPMLLVVERPGMAYLPDGQRIELPAGTELDMCVHDNSLLQYDLQSMTIIIPKPCNERPLFADGFEGDPQLPRKPERPR